MTRTIDEIRTQEQLVISPEMLRSPRATVYRSGAMLSVYSYEPGYPSMPNVSSSALWLWFTLVATAAAVWWLEQGSGLAVYLVAGSIGLVVHAIFCLVRDIYTANRKGADEEMHVLSISMRDEYGANFFESRDKAEVDAVRAEVEQAFAGLGERRRAHEAEAL